MVCLAHLAAAFRSGCRVHINQARQQDPCMESLCRVSLRSDRIRHYGLRSVCLTVLPARAFQTFSPAVPYQCKLLRPLRRLPPAPTRTKRPLHNDVRVRRLSQARLRTAVELLEAAADASDATDATAGATDKRLTPISTPISTPQSTSAPPPPPPRLPPWPSRRDARP
eukprot:3067475-Pleurochrysis_carterae.AAC.3